MKYFEVLSGDIDRILCMVWKTDRCSILDRNPIATLLMSPNTGLSQWRKRHHMLLVAVKILWMTSIFELDLYFMTLYHLSGVSLVA